MRTAQATSQSTGPVADGVHPQAVNRGTPAPGQCPGLVYRDGDPARNCVLIEHDFLGDCEDVEGYTTRN